MNFVKRIDTRLERILCVHGEESKCIELASAIYRKYKIPTTPPQNLETIRLV
jgi:predicted metal-dependent RNase